MPSHPPSPPLSVDPIVRPHPVRAIPYLVPTLPPFKLVPPRDETPERRRTTLVLVGINFPVGEEEELVSFRMGLEQLPAAAMAALLVEALLGMEDQEWVVAVEEGQEELHAVERLRATACPIFHIIPPSISRIRVVERMITIKEAVVAVATTTTRGSKITAAGVVAIAIVTFQASFLLPRRHRTRDATP